MKKSIGIITGLIFAVSAFFVVAASANAENYKISSGGNTSYTNAPTTSAGSSSKVITVKNDRKKSVTSRSGNKTKSATSENSKKSSQDDNDQNQDTDESKKTEDTENGGTEEHTLKEINTI